MGFKLCLVGAGNMGGAMLSGWLESGVPAADIYVLDPKPSQAMLSLMADSKVQHLVEPDAQIKPDIFILAVKPQIMGVVLPTLVPMVSQECVAVSVAAGTTVQTIENALGQLAIVRAMPNTPALMRKGMTAAFANEKVSKEQRGQVSELLQSIGKFAWVEDEGQIDSVTAVSGSGPAYVFYLAECMTAAGVEAGLDEELAEMLARETIAGAGAMLSTLEEKPSRLRENVTSPNGTTAAALSVLMDEPGMREIVLKAVLSAKKRSEEL